MNKDKYFKTNLHCEFGYITEVTYYSPEEVYIDLHTQDFGKWLDVTFDEQNVPLVKYNGENSYNPTSIFLYGLEIISKYYLTKNEELLIYIHAIAQYALEKQDQEGGWLHIFDYDFWGLPLTKDWHSAIAQGYGMSFLVRYYYLTGDPKYLESAKRAALLFEKDTEEGGVRGYIFDKYIWYEEYPTKPCIHVLNGFMFSLIGLYDLYYATHDTHYHHLFKLGFDSLEALIGLYDCNNFSTYDLQSIVMPIRKPNINCVYHLTHIRLLSTLLCIVKSETLLIIMKRWIEYAQGNMGAQRIRPTKITEEIVTPDSGSQTPLALKIKYSDSLNLTDHLQYEFKVFENNQLIFTQSLSPNQVLNYLPSNFTATLSVILKIQDQFHNYIYKNYNIS